jgi:hypothetical protein
MKLPLAHLDVAIIEEVPLELWKEVFNVVGWPPSLGKMASAFEHKDVLEALTKDDPTDELLQALEALHSLGTAAGRDAIVSAMNDRRVPLTILPPNTGEREFVLHLFLAQRSDASLAEVFNRAQTEIQEGAEHRRYNEFHGKDSRPVDRFLTKQAALQQEILEFCRQTDMGEHVNVRGFDDDGDYVFTVIRSHHTKKPLAIVPGRSARTVIEYRPVHGDVIRYSAASGRLRVAARVSNMVDFYRHALGRVLFDDDKFFSGESVYSLRVLQETGRAAFDNHRVAGVGRVWMTECLWERGDRDLLHIRSSDCFRNIEELKLPLTEGTLIQAKLKVEVVGKSTRPVTVVIRQATSRIEVSQKTHEELIDQLVIGIGIRDARSGSSRLDIWALYPWRHPTHVWRALFGRELDRLVEERILIPIQLHSVSPNNGSERVLEAHNISPGEYIGVSRVPEIQSRSLSATDLDGLELNAEHLRQYLRKVLGSTGAEHPWDRKELIDLGFIQLAEYKFHVSFALRKPPNGIGDLVRSRASGAPAIILYPSTCKDGSELAKLVLNSSLPSRSEVIRGAIAVYGLETKLPAIFHAPEGTRLVVDTNLGKVWIDGIEIAGLQAGTQNFQFVETLARKCPSKVRSHDLAEAMASKTRVNQDGDTVVRQAKTTTKKLITAAMAKSEQEFNEDPFPTGPKCHYRCALSSYVT